MNQTSRYSLSSWLPYLSLAATMAAFSWNAPLRFALLLNGGRPAVAAARTMTPMLVNYPLPVSSLRSRKLRPAAQRPPLLGIMPAVFH